MHEDRTRPGPSPSPPEPAPEVAACGFYLVPRPGGFVLHMSTSPEHLQTMRAQVFKTVTGAGVDEEIADAARLVASELVGNAVRLCGPWTPVVVQVVTGAGRVLVRVHDPEPAAVPSRRDERPDNAVSESGRGLWIVDMLAPGWTVEPTPVGKQITCALPLPERAAA